MQVKAKPTPRVTWLHNGEPIRHRDVKVSQNEEGVCELGIPEVFPEDEGEYACIAQNKLGEAETTAVLHVERKTPSTFATALQIDMGKPIINIILFCSAYEYIPDSEIASTTIHSVQESEEDLLDDVDFETDIAPEFVVPLENYTPSLEGEPLR